MSLTVSRLPRQGMLTLAGRSGILGAMHSRKSYRGFTILEIAIALIVIGVLTSAYLQGLSIWLNYKNMAATSGHIKEVEDAMAHYMERYGHYPCPAYPVVEKDEDGRAREDCMKMTPLERRDAQKKGLYITSQKNGEVAEGAVPYRDLGIGRSSATDGWGNMLTYAVTGILADDKTFDEAKGAIDIVDISGMSAVVPQGSVLWALISHGRDGAGAYSAGGRNLLPCPDGTADASNCAHDGTYRIGNYAAAAGQDHYDDVVSYHSWVDTPPSPSPRYCTLDASNMQRGPSIMPHQIQDGIIVRDCGHLILPIDDQYDAQSKCRFLLCRSGHFVPAVIDLERLERQDDEQKQIAQ